MIIADWMNEQWEYIHDEVNEMTGYEEFSSLSWTVRN